MNDMAYLFGDAAEEMLKEAFEKSAYEIFDENEISDTSEGFEHGNDENSGDVFYGADGENYIKNYYEAFNEEKSIVNSMAEEKSFFENSIGNADSLFQNSENILFWQAQNNMSFDGESPGTGGKDREKSTEREIFSSERIFEGASQGGEVKEYSEREKIAVTVNNSISVTKECDIDEVLNSLAEKIAEAVEMAGEGIHI